jgi:hypothetical protein
MAVPNPERPAERMTLGPTGGALGATGSGGSNRPIPLKPKTSPDKIPEPDYDDEDDDTDELQVILRNAPAWLVSTVFHMLLLIVLGLLAVTAGIQSADTEVEIGYAESLGTQLDDPSVLSGDSTHVEGEGKEQMITPRDLPPVEDPFAAPPNLGEINVGSLSLGDAGIDGRPRASGNVDAPMIGMALKGRSKGSRNVLLGAYGGNATTEEAVVRGLEWLVKNQRADGLWSLSGPYPDASGWENTPAATAMALLAFQGHGDTHREGKYSKVVQKAWTALLKNQTKDGAFGRDIPERSQQLYTHAQCAIALCELYGMTHDSQYRMAAERAIAYAVATQDKKKGGWRYMPGEDSDTSVTGWFVMALQSARMAGMKVPAETLDKISAYLDSASLDDGRRYGYWGAASASPAVCAEGLLCRQYLGWKQDDPRLVEGVAALNNMPVAYNGPDRDVYYWYYATQAAHHMEGKIWDDWNKVMRQEVPSHQVKAGAQAGSWDPGGDKWGSFGGRLYVTCLSIYMLEVYYRHLPLYSGYKFVAGEPAPSAPAAAEPAAEAEKKESE